MDVQVEREQRVHLRDSEDERAAQVPPSDEAKLLNVDRRRSCRDAGRIAAEPRQRRVSGEFSLPLSMLSCRCCAAYSVRSTTKPFRVYNFDSNRRVPCLFSRRPIRRRLRFYLRFYLRSRLSHSISSVIVCYCAR